jgi:hypothetical protein
MDGMTMMLKSMGIDPDKIKGQFEQTASQVMTKVDNIEASQARVEAVQSKIATDVYDIETRQSSIELKLDLLISLLREHSHIDGPGQMDAMQSVQSEPEHAQFALSEGGAIG